MCILFFDIPQTNDDKLLFLGKLISSIYSALQALLLSHIENLSDNKKNIYSKINTTQPAYIV